MIKNYCVRRTLKFGIHVYFLFATCHGSIPLTDGTWLSSDRGTWTVNSSTITGFSSSLSVASPTSTLTYMSHTGTLYLFNTTTSFLGLTIPFYTCIDFQISTTSVSIFYIVTAFDSSVSDRFTGDSSSACSNTGYQTTDNRHVLVPQGVESSYSTPLPNVIRGEYSVNFTSVSGMTTDGITLDTCNNTSLMRFNSAGSSGQNVGFSGAGYLISLYSIQSGTVTYLYTFNNDSSVDGSSTHRLVCWVISHSSFGVYASVFPGTCQSTQNSTYTPSGGQLLSLTASSATEDSADPNITLIIIVVVCVVVVIVVIIVIVIVVVIKKKTKKKDDADGLKEGKTRDVSVSTSVYSGDSSCIPWLGRGAKTVSTSTSDLNSVTFYLPLKYTKRPGDTENSTTKNTRPATGSLHRSKSEVSNISEHVEKDKPTKQPFRFVQYVGVVKKDTKTKAIVDTHWQNGTPNGLRNGKTTKHKQVTVQEEMSRAKTFHDFEREFDETHKFPVTFNNYDKWANTQKEEKLNIENKTTQNLSIGDSGKASSTSDKKRGIVRVRSQEELDQVTCHDNVSGTENQTNDNRVYFKRSRTIPGINYTSPYAMTKEQKDYIAKRKAWVSMQHNHERSKQKWLKELKKKESEKAYQDWMKYKATMADKMRSSLRRTQSQPPQALENSLPTKVTTS